jgi:ankyrin repeat protein
MASSTGLVGANRVDLRKSLRQYFADHKLDEREIDAFEQGYCSDIDVVEAVTNWYIDELPNLKDKATAGNIAWADKLYEIAGEILDADFSQSNLMDMYVKFLETYPHPEHIRDKDELIHKLKNGPGHCDGFAFAVGAAYLLERTPKRFEKGVAIPRNDWTWLKGVFKTLIHWDGKSALDSKKNKDILASLRLIFNAQNSPTKLSIDQSDWDKIYSDTCGREYKSQSVVLPFDQGKGTRKLVTTLLKSASQKPVVKMTEIKATETIQDEPEYDVELLKLGINAHATLIIQETNRKTGAVQYLYYDSNNCRGMTLPISNSRLLDLLLQRAHWLDKTKTDFHMISGKFFNFDGAKRLISLDQIATETELKALNSSNLGTYLNYATSEGNEGMFQYLLDHDANPSLKTARGYTTLHEAAKHGRATFVKKLGALTHNKPDVEAESKIAGVRAIHSAARYGHADAIREVIALGANIEAKTKSTAPKHAGWNALHIASHFGHSEVVRVLLDEAINNYARTTDGSTAISLAVSADHLDVADILIEDGVDLLEKFGGKSLLDLAKSDAMRKRLQPAMLLDSITRNRFDVTQELLDSKVDIDVMNPLGKNALQTAVEKNSIDAVDFLTDRNADVLVMHENKSLLDLATTQGMRLFLAPIMLKRAIEVGNVAIIRQALLYAAINFPLFTGELPLMIAVKSGNLESIAELCTAGADVNALGEKGQTALSVAAAAGRLDIVKLLIQNRADLLLKANQAAMDVAKDSTICEFIKQEIAKANLQKFVSGKKNSALAKLSVVASSATESKKEVVVLSRNQRNKLQKNKKLADVMNAVTVRVAAR